MSIQINNYSYSYADAVGSACKQPLFTLISNIAIAQSGKPWETNACRIAKMVLHCFIAALLIVPVGLAYLAGKAICCFRTTQLNLKLLSLAPPKVEFLEDTQKFKSIDIFELVNRAKTFPNIPITRVFGLQKLCEWVTNKNGNIYSDNWLKQEMFCVQVSNFLKGILDKFHKGEVSKDKEQDVIRELGEASQACYPTWLEMSSKLFSELSGQETVEVKLLRCIQEYKEGIILEFCQKEVNGQWHGLNFVRNILGKELGLNTLLNEYDAYAGTEDLGFGKSISKWLFLQRYESVNRLVAAIQNMINSRKYDRAYFDHLVACMTQRGVTNPSDYVAKHFYSDEYKSEDKLNEAGIYFLLKDIAILT